MKDDNVIGIAVEGLAMRFGDVQAVADGADILHGAFNGNNTMSFALDFCVLGALCIFLFAWSLRNNKRRWIL
jgi:hypothetical protein